jgi:hypothetical protein
LGYSKKVLINKEKEKIIIKLRLEGNIISIENNQTSIQKNIKNNNSSDLEKMLYSSPIFNDEINEYLKLPLYDPNRDPLEWWKLNCTTFPKLARKYLCIQASSGYSERVWSQASNICK